MKINPKTVQERLEGVPDSKRSHIYYAGLVLEFLDQNFVPTRKWLPELYKVQPGTPVDNDEFTASARKYRTSLSELYDMYLRWRNVKDYTSEVESRYKFSIIIRHLRLYKNGWEFDVHRVGTAQVWFVGPLAFASELPETRRKIEPATIERGSVDLDPLMPPRGDWRETRNWVPTHDWTITEFELEQ